MSLELRAQTKTPLSPLEVLSALKLDSALPLNELSARKSAYEVIHLGMQDVSVGRLCEVLRKEECLKAPRTGHLGNWEDILAGRAGAMDFNHAICSSGLGYPLICCFTQTEGPSEQTGDWVYLPGSLVNQGKRKVLQLLTWDGQSFVRRDRSRSYFCPFTQVEVDGSAIPLVQFHWQRMKAISSVEFCLEPKIILQNLEQTKAMLACLLERARFRENTRRSFQDIISHAVEKDGTVNRCEIVADSTGYYLDEVRYSSVHSLVEHAMIPFQAVLNPENIFKLLPSLPSKIPVLSNLIIGVLSALFKSHYPQLIESNSWRDYSYLTQPCNLHLHWGARAMAGYPPRSKGYLVERSTTRSLRWICTALLEGFTEVDPLCIALLPASIFMLCPTTAHSCDSEMISQLFSQVLECRVPPESEDDITQFHRIEKVTLDWFDRYERSISRYFICRFQPRVGILHPAELPKKTEPIEPEGFSSLSVKEACMIVGALSKRMENKYAFKS